MVKLIELFGGIGACSAALKRCGIDYEIVDYVEIDKYAVASYNAINNTTFEPQDITAWDKDIKSRKSQQQYSAVQTGRKQHCCRCALCDI